MIKIRGIKMKITKRKLKKIIAEEVKNLEYALAQKVAVPPLSAAENPEDVEAHEDAWAGGENIHNQIDHAEAFHDAESTTRGIEIMSITELRKIIRLALNENRHWRGAPEWDEEQEMWDEGEMGWEEYQDAEQLALSTQKYREYTEPGSGKPYRKRKYRKKGKSQSWRAKAARHPDQTKLF